MLEGIAASPGLCLRVVVKEEEGAKAQSGHEKSNWLRTMERGVSQHWMIYFSWKLEKTEEGGYFPSFCSDRVL